MNKSAIILAAVLAVGIAAGFGIAKIAIPQAPTQTAQSDEKKVQYWVAPMDPNYRRDEPGKSPMGMDLVPVYEGEEPDSGGQPALQIEPAVVNNLGVRTAAATSGAFSRQVETVGYIVPNDDRQSEVTVRTAGWIEELAVKTPGETVEAGQLLFRMYAPELANAQAEYLEAARRGNTRLRDAARERLRALGMTAAQIDTIAEKGETQTLTEVRAPQDGTLLDLSVTEGAYVAPGTVIARLADLSSVWVMAEIVESQVPWIAEGAAATMRLAFAPGETRQGHVDYIYPTVTPESRTVKLRLVFDNPGGALKPNMYADLTIDGKTRKNVVTIPQEALIRTAGSDRVILAFGDGRFRPAQVVPGVESGDRVEIVQGLSAGEQVVTSAQFLIDSEASVDASLMRLASDPLDAEMDDEMGQMDMPAQTSPETVSGTGRVTAVQPEENQVTLAHDPMPEIGWPSMTMGFSVETGLADDLAPGDRIEFDMTQKPDGTYMITGTRKTGAEGEGE